MARLEPARWPELYRAGMTIEDIAFEAGMSPTTVGVRLRAEGVEMRKPGERPGVERRPGPSSGDLTGLREPGARIVRPSVQRRYR